MEDLTCISFIDSVRNRAQPSRDLPGLPCVGGLLNTDDLSRIRVDGVHRVELVPGLLRDREHGVY